MNTSMLLEMVAGAAGDRVAFGSSNGGLTYGDVFAKANGVARLIKSRKAERLGMIDINSEVTPVALFGAGLAGVPFAPINYRLPDEQLRAICQRLAPAVVIVGPDVEDRIGDIGGLELIDRDAFMAQATEAAAAGEGGDDLDFVDPDDIAVLLFTSGTTGEPKAAVLRHRHLTSYIIGTVEFLGADENDAQLVSVPPYHIAGISSVLSSTYAGRRVMYLPAFDPADWVRIVADERITQAMVVPTMLGRILDEMTATGASLDSLHHLSYGGGRMPVELIERAMGSLPQVAYVNAYGLTETSSTIAVLGPDDHREAFASDDPAVRARLGSVGKPLPSVELEIRGPLGEVLPPGEKGEIYVRGEQVAGEYLGRDTSNDDGWFATNDAGHLDDDGYLFLDGRLDDVIVRGAENLSPGEIEDTLIAHPAVKEAAVIGVPDPEWGEAVAAVVVLDASAAVTEDELKAWVRERLRSTKTPERIEFRPELPYNETGKLLRRVLKSELAESAHPA